MADNTPQSREEALLQNILGAQNEIGIPKSRIEKIWQYALGIDGVELEPAKSRIEVLAIQVAELVRNGGGGTVDHTAEDGILTGTLTGSYTNDRVTELKTYGMTSLSNMTSVSFPEVTDLIPNYFFSACTSLQNVNIPKATRIGDHTFRNCTSLIGVSFPNITSISTYAFQNCSSLEWLSFDDVTEVPTLSNTNAFQGCSSLAAFYFPDALVASAKTSSNWTAYAEIIKPLSQKPTA